MSAKAETPEMSAAQGAIAAEIRASIARKGISHQSIYTRLGQTQSWFSRRFSGKTPWSAEELLAVANIIDEDITVVMAAGTLAMEQARKAEARRAAGRKRAARKTNPCLSDSDSIGSQRLGTWMSRGLQLAVMMSGSPRFDGTANAA